MEERRFSSHDVANIHFVYGFCNGNANAAVREYTRRFPNKPTLNARTFIRLHSNLSEYGIRRPANERTHLQTNDSETQEILRATVTEMLTLQATEGRERDLARGNARGVQFRVKCQVKALIDVRTWCAKTTALVRCNRHARHTTAPHQSVQCFPCYWTARTSSRHASNFIQRS
ncbi:unnamed protein product [Colias eurytheme]|nr:unnamed protein product [Colias eurytheme]